MVRISKREFNLIGSTPRRECFICDEIFRHAKKVEYTTLIGIKIEYEISDTWLNNNGYTEHLEQIRKFHKIEGKNNAIL